MRCSFQNNLYGPSPPIVGGNLSQWEKERGKGSAVVSENSRLGRVPAAAEERHPFGEHLTACRVPGSN